MTKFLLKSEHPLAILRFKSIECGFLGYTLGPILNFYIANFSNGPQLISLAFGGTGLVFVSMAAWAQATKRDVSSMGKWLMVGAVVLMVGSIINVFVGSSAGMMVISMLSMAIFSAFMLYDLKQVMDGGETNYISATLTLYLDIINVFQSLLALLGIFGGERD